MSVGHTHPVPPPAEKKLKTRPEAAAYIRVARNTLAIWASRGCGPKFIKLGRSVRYDVAELDRYLAERTCQSTAESERLAD